MKKIFLLLSFLSIVVVAVPMTVLAQTTDAVEQPSVLLPNDLDVENPDAIINKDTPGNAAAKPVPVDEAKASEIQKPAPEVKDSKEKSYMAPQYQETSYTQQFSILADAAILSMWVPYKLGFTFAWRLSPDWAVETSLLRGKIDLDNAGVEDVGDASEGRFDLIVRKYFGPSFSVFAGYSAQKVKAAASQSIKDNNPGLPFYDTEIKTSGLIAGLGNRWIWDNGITFGVDWFSVIVPMSSKVNNDFKKIVDSDYANADDAAKIKDAVDKIENNARLTLLHVRLGWTF